MEIPGGGGSNVKPSGTENPVGWGVQLEKIRRGEGGGVMDITTQFLFQANPACFNEIYQNVNDLVFRDKVE